MIVDIYNTNKKYNIIYADPPWLYWAGGHKNATKHYNCMKKEDIYKLGETIKNICYEDCILFLWVTFPCLKEGLETIEKWGFKYSTMGFTWVKKNKKSDSWFWGLGNWTRANCEICLIATKGKPKRLAKNIHSLIVSKIRNHSQKPDEAREKIVALMGICLELSYLQDSSLKAGIAGEMRCKK